MRPLLLAAAAAALLAGCSSEKAGSGASGSTSVGASGSGSSGSTSSTSGGTTGGGTTGLSTGSSGGSGGGSIVPGPHHSCGAAPDGSVTCFGRNQYGERGANVAGDSPANLAAIDHVVELATGQQSTCARKDDGSIWCFGRIMAEATSNFPPPAQVPGLSGAAQALSVGDSQRGPAAAITGDGALWVSNGQQPPTFLPFQPQAHAVQVSVANGFLCYVDAAGGAYCSGDNSAGQLGDGTTTSSAVDGGPVAVQVGPARQVSAGGNFACALLQDGTVWCWGANEIAQTGSASSSASCNWSSAGAAPCNPVPVQVSGLPSAPIAISTGYDTGYALLANGQVWGWGDDANLQLGGASAGHTCTNLFGTSACSEVPAQVPVSAALTTLRASRDSACGCAADGAAWCWGSNDSAMLGNFDGGSPTPPAPMQGFRCH